MSKLTHLQILEGFNHRLLAKDLQEVKEINLGFVALEPVVSADTSKLWATGKTLRSRNGHVKLASRAL
jgi:hypothetical protein